MIEFDWDLDLRLSIITSYIFACGLEAEFLEAMPAKTSSTPLP
jgi:hypothetical protein